MILKRVGNATFNLFEQVHQKVHHHAHRVTVFTLSSHLFVLDFMSGHVAYGFGVMLLGYIDANSDHHAMGGLDLHEVNPPR